MPSTERTKARWRRILGRAVTVAHVIKFILYHDWMAVALTGEYDWLIWGIVLTAGILALVLTVRLLGINLLPKPSDKEREYERYDLRVEVVVVVRVRVDQGVTSCWLRCFQLKHSTALRHRSSSCPALLAGKYPVIRLYGAVYMLEIDVVAWGHLAIGAEILRDKAEVRSTSHAEYWEGELAAGTG